MAFFSSPSEERAQRHQPAAQRNKSMLPSYLWQMVDDNQKIKDLEDKLSYVAEVRNLDIKFKAVQRVGEWQLEQLKLMDPRTNKGVKRLGEWQLQQLKLIETEKTKQVLKLHNMEKGKWKVERDKLRVERDNWKVTCKKLKDEACVREQRLRKLTMESQRWKAECTKLVTAEFEGKDVIGVCRDLLDQLQVEQKSLDVQRRTGDWLKVPNAKTPTAELKKLPDGTRGQPAQNVISRKSGQRAEGCVSQQQLQQKVRAGKSEGEKLEEVCKDLLYQLERRNIEIRSNQVNLQKASKWQALMQREINDYKEEIKQLKKTEVSECIICTNEFGEEPDRHRAYWQDCNHANICYRCTKTLWSSNKRNCPTCKTPASTIPTRLPPKIYL